jgi:HEPN domain-containing protein
MKLLEVSKALLGQAEARLEDGREALQDQNFAYCVRLSAECVELSLKAILKLVGIEYPKKHDVSGILLLAINRFPNWFRDHAPRIAESNKILTKKREPALYGCEEAFLAPEDVISKEDATDAIKRAEEAYNACKKLVDTFRI